MGFEDRDYYRESQAPTNPVLRALYWVLTGSLPLFTVFGIHVRIHASAVVLAVLFLLFSPLPPASTIQFLVTIFVIILLHEFGHCFGARWMGGEARLITMTPLGGLAHAEPIRRPWPTFVCVAAGPAVNVIICIVCGIGVYLTSGVKLIGPWTIFGDQFPTGGWLSVTSYLWYAYSVSWALLLFNLLPIYYLDGGQMLQAALWKRMGWYRSMLLTVNIGIAGAVIMMMLCLAGAGPLRWIANLTLWIMLSCLLRCIEMRRMLIAEGPYAFEEETDTTDYSAARESWKEFDTRERKERQRVSKRELKAQAKAEKEAAAREAERVANEAKLDQVLAKISSQGKDSLSRSERKFLEQMTEAKRKAKS